MNIVNKKLHRNLDGFTLIELMITIVIIAVLTGIAVVAYNKYINSARQVDARTFLSTIQARQETYFQRFGWYANATGDTTTYYPALGNSHCVGGGSAEPCAKPWNDSAYKAPAGWVSLGARPESSESYFEWLVVASDPSASHAIGSDALKLGIPAQPTNGVSPHPWYYVIGRADLNSSGTPCATGTCTVLYSTSARSEIVTQYEGN